MYLSSCIAFNLTALLAVSCTKYAAQKKVRKGEGWMLSAASVNVIVHLFVGDDNVAERQFIRPGKHY